jgi:hypothetical protein
MEMMVFVLKYFALIAQKPNSKYGGTGLIFHSTDQGAGKSVFIKFMCLLFDPYTDETNNLEDLCGRFSTCMEEKVILHLEDPPGPQLTKFSEYLKGLITADTTSIERKGKDAYRVANFCRFVLSTNYIEKLRLEPSDRRWTLIECSNLICNSCVKIAEMQTISRTVENRINNTMEVETKKSVPNNESQEYESEDVMILTSSEDIDFSDFKQIKGIYFKLLNIYFRRSRELQRKVFNTLLHDISIKNFHPEQNRPKSQLLLNCRSQTLPPLHRFLMGLGNYFYLFPKKRELFPAQEKGKHWVWISSSLLLEKYHDWATLNYDQFQKYSAPAFATAFKRIKGDDLLSPKDYSPIYKYNIRHLPIDWEYWRLRLQQLDLDLKFIIDADELAAKTRSAMKKKKKVSETNSTLKLEMSISEKEREEMLPGSPI